MRLQYRHQKFQADAARAVVDVFAGQPYLTPTYMMDRGSGNYQIGVNEERDFTGFSNQRIVPELSDQRILEQLNKIQRANQIICKFSQQRGIHVAEIGRASCRERVLIQV